MFQKKKTLTNDRICGICESHWCFSTKNMPHIGLFIERTFQEKYTRIGDPQKYFYPDSREFTLNREMCQCPFKDVCCLPTPPTYAL